MRKFRCIIKYMAVGLLANYMMSSHKSKIHSYLTVFIFWSCGQHCCGFVIILGGVVTKE